MYDFSWHIFTWPHVEEPSLRQHFCYEVCLESGTWLRLWKQMKLIMIENIITSAGFECQEILKLKNWEKIQHSLGARAWEVWRHNTFHTHCGVVPGGIPWASTNVLSFQKTQQQPSVVWRLVVISKFPTQKNLQNNARIITIYKQLLGFVFLVNMSYRSHTIA